jgi:hypothetical protein
MRRQDAVIVLCQQLQPAAKHLHNTLGVSPAAFSLPQKLTNLKSIGVRVCCRNSFKR